MNMPQNINKIKTTDTPRTDEAAGHAMGIINERVLFCSRQLELELAHSLANQIKSQAEVERLLERAENAEADLIRTQIEMQLEIDKEEAEVERLTKKLRLQSILEMIATPKSHS